MEILFFWKLHFLFVDLHCSQIYLKTGKGMKIYLRNKKNSIEEHYTILALLKLLGGNLSREDLTSSVANEFYYIEDDGNGKMIIRTTDATNLENGEIYTVDEFLSKYETNSNFLVDRIH